MLSFLSKKFFSQKLNVDFNFLSKWCFYFFVFSVPFRIDVLFFTENLYLNGFFNIYQSHFFYFSDLIFILGILCLMFSFLTNLQNLKFSGLKNLSGSFYIYTVLLLFLILGSFLWSFNNVNSFLHTLRLLQFILFFLVLKSGFLNLKTVLYSFLASVLFSAVVGFFQYFYQGSIGLHFLGESFLSLADPGVAKIDFLGEKVIRSYGMFSHPNIFAGYLIFAIAFCFYFFQNSKGRYRLIFAIFIPILLIAFLLTFSRSAYLALVVGFIFYLFLKKIRISMAKMAIVISIIIFFLFASDFGGLIFQRLSFSDSSNLIERGRFLVISRDMFFDYPFGVGIGNFTALMQDYYPQKLMPWNYQPVHNLYLLVLNELGIFGLIGFLSFFIHSFLSLYKRTKSDDDIKKQFVYILLALWLGVMILGMFDHYFWSFYTGQFLFWFFMGLVFYKKPNLQR